MKSEIVSPSDLAKGDVILLDGVMQTVSRETVRHSSFSGILINGQRM